MTFHLKLTALTLFALTFGLVPAQGQPDSPLERPIFVRVIKHDGPTKAEAMTTLCSVYADRVDYSKTTSLLKATRETSKKLTIGATQALDELIDAASQGAIEEKELEGLVFSKTYRAKKPGAVAMVTLLEINSDLDMTKKNISLAAQALVKQIDRLCD